MYDCSNDPMYPELIASIKKLNHEKRVLTASDAYSLGKKILQKKKEIKDGGLKAVLEIVNHYVHFQKTAKRYITPSLPVTRDYGESNYYSQDKIAVYTCITGGYDQLVEPLFIPDNCDFFAVTDFEIPEDSRWKRIDAFSVDEKIDLASPVLRNRYFKIHPDVLFPEYKYSAYVDGNIRICTDMTEYVNRISQYGVSFFAHPNRACVYEEAETCVALGKESRKNIDIHVAHLKEENMPKDYGLAQCGIIVREHNAHICKMLMQHWWQEFTSYAKRDQLSLPYVMFKHGITMDEVTTLGTDLCTDDSFEVIRHSKKS